MDHRVEEAPRAGRAPVPSRVSQVALLSVHTCPLDQPGTGDSGGMNVYVRQVSRRLADMGVSVDVFTRHAGRPDRIAEVHPGVRVIHLEAGPAHPIPKEELADHLCQFLYSLVQFETAEATRAGTDGNYYDVLHSHYWLSGWVGRMARERWRIPLVQSFHTLGRVKNETMVGGDAPEPPTRIAMEERIVQTADCVLAPTADESADLIRLYGAHAGRVRVVSPGVETNLFAPVPPGARAAAKRALGFEGRSLVLFVGRLQPLKGPDVAVRAVADLAARRPDLDPALHVVGGPSGNGGLRPTDLEKLAAELGAADLLTVGEPVPHVQLPQLYRAADVVLIPSRSESFGLVALEAAACGTPVVASDVGGLRTTVRDGSTGILVDHADPEAFSSALEHVLADPARARTMGDAGARFALRYDWRNAASGLLGVYEDEVTRSRARDA